MDPGQIEVNQATTKARVGVRQLRSELSGYLARAAAGETIIVTVGGQAKARLAPLDHDDRRSLEALARGGGVHPPTAGDRRALGRLEQHDDGDLPPPWIDQVAGLDAMRLLSRIRG